MEQNRRISGQAGVLLSVVNAVLGNCLHKHRHTNTHEKIPSSTHHPPLKLSLSSIRCRCVCVSVCKGDADSASNSSHQRREAKIRIPAEKSRENIFHPLQEQPLRNRLGDIFPSLSFLFFFYYYYFTVKVHERRMSAAK